jgi:4a-hydroxytetrahydrobiopterin dehydratase
MKLSPQEIDARLKTAPGWKLESGGIQKRFTFSGFPEAVAFLTRLVEPAEAADHHPDIQVSYKRVTLTYTTHSEGGLTARDFDGAATAERIAKELGAE